MFYKPEINVNPNDIEACHHLRNQDKKNSQGRKIASMYWKLKKDLSKLTFEDINLARDSNFVLTTEPCDRKVKHFIR